MKKKIRRKRLYTLLLAAVTASLLCTAAFASGGGEIGRASCRERV